MQWALVAPTSPLRALLVAVLASLALGACSSASTTSQNSQSTEFREFYEQLSGGSSIEEAREQGLSEAQAEILERVAARGEVTLADLQEALNNTFACFDEHGITHTQQRITYLGHEEISYSYGAPPGYEDDDPAWVSLADACMDANSNTIDMLYQMAPGVVVQQEQWFVANLRDELTECLSRYGVVVPQGADELWFSQAVTDLAQPQGGAIDECEVMYSLGIYGK